MAELDGSGLDRPPEVIFDRGSTDVSRAVRAVREGLIDELVSGLGRITALSSVAGRDLLRDEIRDRLGALTLRDHDAARLWFVELVKQCLKTRSGLAELAASVGFLAPGDTEALEVQRLVEQLEALTFEPKLGPHWRDLRRALAPVPLREAQQFIHHVTDGRLGLLPTHCTDTWSAFVHLVGQNSLPQQLTPWMTFLELVRDRLEAEAGETVRRLIRRIAGDWGVTGDLEEVRADYQSYTQPVLRAGVLTIVVSPDPMDPDSFTLHSIQRWDDDGAVPVRGEEIEVNRADLAAEVEAVVRKAEEDWSTRPTELKLEFVLPLQLLNEPVEWWPKDSQIPPSVPLALYHSVVIRSYERMRRISWHRVWIRRWETMMREPAICKVHRGDHEREDHLRLLEAELNSDDRYVAVVLSAPPVPDARSAQEIMVALRSGIPVILWHRAGGSAVWQTLNEDLPITDGFERLRSLPDHAAQLRRDIEGLHSSQREAHPGRELSVLWDNPNRVPQMSTVASSSL